MWYRLLLLVLAGPLLAAESQTSLLFEGNTRTQTIYLESLGRRCLAQQTGELDLPELEQCFMNARIFTSVKAERRTDQVRVTIEERWTLIPVPAVSAGSGSSRGFGLYLFESNFLGLGMTSGLGASFSDRGTSGFAMISDPSLFFTDWFASVTASISQEQFHLYEKEQEINGFEENAVGGRLTLGRRFGDFSPSLAYSYSQRDYEDYETYATPVEDRTHSLTTSLAYDQRDYRLYFLEGFHLKLDWTRELSREAPVRRASRVETMMSWQSNVVRDHALQIQLLAGNVEGGRLQDAYRLGGGTGFRGSESKSLWLDRYYAVSADYQIPLRTFEGGVLTTAPFVDLSRSYSVGGNWREVDTYASGLGLYYYFKRIAIPGFGFQFGYNPKYLGTFFKVSAGASL